MSAGLARGERLRLGIVGGAGYSGLELLRLLAAHPAAEVCVVTSREYAGQPLARLAPNLSGAALGGLSCTAPELDELCALDAVFFATPHGVAMRMAPALLAAGVRVIDLSADFRLRDPARYAEWYGHPRLIANPGCYPTATTLALAPLLRAGIVEQTGLIVDAKSGVSGAGRKAELPYLFGEVSENFRVYGTPRHRHTPEIAQVLQGVLPAESAALGLVFVPHLLPMIRGMEITAYARLRPGAGLDDARACLAAASDPEPFLTLLPEGEWPQTKAVAGSNQVHLGVTLAMDGCTVVVSSVIDNLVKGAAGQAVQNFNLMFDLPETLALDFRAGWP